MRLLAKIQNWSHRGIFKQRLGEKREVLFSVFYITMFWELCSDQERKKDILYKAVKLR